MNKYFAVLLCTNALAFPVLAEDGPVQACQQSLRAGEFDKAAEYADQAIRADAGNRDAYLCLGRARGWSGAHLPAVEALQEADKRSKSPVEHMQALTLLGREHQSARAYAEARVAYQKSLDLARSERNVYFQHANLIALGEILQAEKDLKGALGLYLEGVRLAANDNERADSQAHLASVHHDMGNHDQAIIQQIKSVVMEERSGDLDHYAQANLDLGRYYSDAGQYANAERTLSKLLEIVIQAGDAYWEARAYMEQAAVRRAQNKMEESRQLLQHALDLANKIGASQLRKEIEEAGKM